MNNRAICISISTATLDELRSKIAIAESNADVIEIRFDALGDAVLSDALKTTSTKPLLLTYRPKQQGGQKELTKEQRLQFRNEAVAVDHPQNSLLDTEYDLAEFAKPQGLLDIRSFHDLETPGKDLDAIFDSLITSTDTIAKIAVSIDDATEAAGLWSVLNRAVDNGRKIIAIAMGEAGKWTRILGPAYGSMLTYGSLDKTSQTAPGQLTADELANVYRVNSLNRSSYVYALLAGDTSYSISPYMHNAVFAAESRNAVFLPLKIRDIKRFFDVMVNGDEIDINFKGFAVTNPHKQTVMQFLDDIDIAATQIGAVNTIKLADGKLYGTNTDAKGFIEPLIKKFGDLRDVRVAVVGAGGAARACVWALMQYKADVSLFARNTSKAANFATEFGVSINELANDKSTQNFNGFDIVVNTTPLGTRGNNENMSIANAEDLSDVKLAYDLTYNPEETLFLQQAALAGAQTLGGLEMLVAQGIEQHKFWYDGDPNIEVMKNGIRSRLNI